MKLNKKICIVMMILSSRVFANESVELGEVVITASGYEQDIRQAPATINVITQDDLKNKNIQNLGQALKEIAGVNVGVNKQGTDSFSIRGYGSNYILILIDGKRKNSISGFFDNGLNATDGFIMPPIESIERIEVIKGASSTLYGSDAIGGVVNIITKKNTNKLYGSIKLNTLINQHSEYANSGGVETFINIPLTDNFSTSFRAKYFNKGKMNLNYPNDVLISNQTKKIKNYNLGTRLNYHFLDDQNIYFDYERLNSVIESQNNQKEVIQNNFVIDYKGEFENTNLQSFALANFMKDKFAFTKSRVYVGDFKIIHPFDFDRYGIFTFSGGINYQYEDYQINSGEAKYHFGNKILSQNTYAPYYELEYFLPENLTITQGLRYTKSNLFDKEISPRIYVSYNLFDNFTIKGGVSKGYKLPRVKDVINGLVEYRYKTKTNLYGNPALKPENSINYEIGLYLDYLDNAFSVVGFITDFENEISESRYKEGELMPNGVVCQKPSNDPTKPPTKDSCGIKINEGKTKTKGIEFGFKSATFYGFSLNASYTLMDKIYNDSKRNIYGGTRFVEFPRHIINSTINYKNNKFSSFFQANAKINTLKNIKDLPSNMQQYRDFYTFDLGFNYDFTKNATLSFVIYNIFDKEYFKPYEYKANTYANEYQNYIDRRNFYLSFKYDF